MKFHIFTYSLIIQLTLSSIENIHLNKNDLLRKFRGIGAISGGGVCIKILYIYIYTHN